MDVQNQSLLQITNFQLTFRRIPNFVFNVQQVNLPGLSTGSPTRPTPFVDVPLPGNKLTYDSLNVGFLVDEDLRAWTEVHDWLRGLTFPTGFDEYRQMRRDKADFGGQYSDATLTSLTNANTANLRIKFYGAFPVSLSQITFDTTQNANFPMLCEASFRFAYYDIERIKA